MQDEILYQAMLARDYRFDGKFFIGVKTTGIYCRPICPAKPKRENVEFFNNSRSAETAGYRPCLRCRPESAPLSGAWFGRSAIVKRALKVIAANGFFDSSEDKFAEQFGVSARHLRRLFVEEVGQTPKQIAFNNRLSFTRKLIVESSLSMTAIAMTAGFSSLRRFNDAFKKKFKRAPSELRKTQTASDKKGIELSLSYRPPLDFESVLSFYRNHLIHGLETVSETTYERVFRHEKSIGVLKVSSDPKSHALKLLIHLDDPSAFFTLVQRVRQMFDLDSDPLLIANSFQSQKSLNSLIIKYPGLRVARAWDPFESAVTTILGQLVSVKQARVFVKELVENYGEKISHPITGEDLHLFPTPQVLAKSDLALVRITPSRRAAIKELAHLVLTKEIDLNLPLDSEESRKQLLSIKGLGAWSSEYIHLRALGDTDAFPATDLILKRSLIKHPDLDLDMIRPWRSYAAIYLWKEDHELRIKDYEISGGNPHSRRKPKGARSSVVGRRKTKPRKT